MVSCQELRDLRDRLFDEILHDSLTLAQKSEIDVEISFLKKEIINALNMAVFYYERSGIYEEKKSE